MASEAGVGSTFAFYVKAKRSAAPLEADSLNRPAVRTASDATGKKVPTTVNAKAGGPVGKKAVKASGPIKVLVSTICV